MMVISLWDNEYRKNCAIGYGQEGFLIMRDRLEVSFFNGIYEVIRVCIRLDGYRFFIYDTYAQDSENEVMEIVYQGENKKVASSYMEETGNMTESDEDFFRE